MVAEVEGNFAVENVSMLSAYDPNRQSPDRVKSCTFSFTNETGKGNQDAAASPSVTVSAAAVAASTIAPTGPARSPLVWGAERLRRFKVGKFSRRNAWLCSLVRNQFLHA